MMSGAGARRGKGLGAALALLAGLLFVAGPGAPAGAQEAARLSAAESDPVRLGWMQGSPPPPDRLVMQPESDYFGFPKLRWTVCHIRELVPTKQVSRGLGAPRPLPRALDAGIDELPNQAVVDSPDDANPGRVDILDWKLCGRGGC